MTKLQTVAVLIIKDIKLREVFANMIIDAGFVFKISKNKLLIKK